MMRTAFNDIPESIVESAYVYGASEYMIFGKFILPMSKPIIATVALFVFLAKWNDWYTCMLYISSPKLKSLQYMLQEILLNLQLMKEMQDKGNQLDFGTIPSETARMATAVVVAGPALVFFPFFQKYFVRGITVGSVKG